MLTATEYFNPQQFVAFVNHMSLLLRWRNRKKRNENFEYGIWMLWASLSTSSRADQHRCQKFNSNDSQTNETKTHKSEAFFLWATICVIVYMWQNLKSGKQLYITPRCAHLRTETTSRMLIRILSRKDRPEFDRKREHFIGSLFSCAYFYLW